MTDKPIADSEISDRRLPALPLPQRLVEGYAAFRSSHDRCRSGPSISPSTLIQNSSPLIVMRVPRR